MSTAARASGVVLAAILATVASAGACVDLSPLDYAGPEGGLPEAATIGDTGGGAQGALCDMCFEAQPTCSMSWKACQADKSCVKFAACMSQTSCWGASINDLMNLSPCVISCSLGAGVTSQNSPTAVIISPLFTCAQDPLRCGPACAGITGDGGASDSGD
jgi:hypothetical protein